MHKRGHFDVSLPSFFNKRDIIEMLRDPEFPYIQQLINEEIELCDQLADEIAEETKENLGIESLESTPESEKISILEDITINLTSIAEVFDLFGYIKSGEMYAWSPPKGEAGTVLMDFVIERPEMQKFDLVKHVFTHPGEEKYDERNIEFWPASPLLYRERTYIKLPKTINVEDLVQMSDGEVENLNKTQFKSTLQDTEELYTRCESFLKENASKMKEIFDFFNREKIRGICSGNNGPSHN